MVVVCHPSRQTGSGEALRRGTAGAGLAEDDERPEIDSREALEAWLTDNPVEWAQVIAVRAALRVFPLVFNVHAVSDGRLYTGRKQVLILQAFRANFISRLAPKYPSREMAASASASADASTSASAFASAASASASAASASAYASAYSARASASADASTSTYSARASTFASAAYSAYSASAAAYSAYSAYSDARAAEAMIWRAVSEDCRRLLEHGTTDDLIDQALWPSNVRGKTSYQANFPPWIREPFDRFAARDEVKNGPWRLIVDWYRAILPNSRNAKPRSLFGEKADIVIATQPDEFWTATEERSAEDILEEIAATGGYDQRGLFDGVLSSLATRILEFLEEVRRPAAFDEIHSAILAWRPVYHPSLEGELGSQLAFGRVIRTSDGLYVHPKWAETDTANWDFFLSYNQHDLAVARASPMYWRTRATRSFPSSTT